MVTCAYPLFPSRSRRESASHPPSLFCILMTTRPITTDAQIGSNQNGDVRVGMNGRYSNPSTRAPPLHEAVLSMLGHNRTRYSPFRDVGQLHLLFELVMNMFQECRLPSWLSGLSFKTRRKITHALERLSRTTVCLALQKVVMVISVCLMRIE